MAVKLNHASKRWDSDGIFQMIPSVSCHTDLGGERLNLGPNIFRIQSDGSTYLQMRQRVCKPWIQSKTLQKSCAWSDGSNLRVMRIQIMKPFWFLTHINAALLHVYYSSLIITGLLVFLLLTTSATSPPHLLSSSHHKFLIKSYLYLCLLFQGTHTALCLCLCLFNILTGIMD